MELNRKMILSAAKNSLSALVSLVLSAMTASGSTGLSSGLVDVSFNDLGPDRKFTTSLSLYEAGRIAIDVTWSSQAELTVRIFRPNGSEASQISGGGGKLTLTYAVNQDEIQRFIDAKTVKWRIEVSTRVRAGPVSGRLQIIYPDAARSRQKQSGYFRTVTTSRAQSADRTLICSLRS
jgi:hypothetical protein